MKTVVNQLPPDWYARPEGIVDKVVCVNPSLYGGNGSGLLPGPSCPAGFRFTEHFVQGTEPTTDDRTFYTSCGINLRAPFFDWQRITTLGHKARSLAPTATTDASAGG